MSKIEEDSLELISRANNYNKWVFAKMKPYLESPVLEVGSGIGTITDYIIKGHNIFATDISNKYVKILKNKFFKKKNFLGSSRLDLTKKLKLKKFRTVVCTNVLHHIEDDDLAIRNINNYLQKGGMAFIQEPAHQALFGSLDIAQDHFHRYSKKELVSKFENNGFKIKYSAYSNMFGALGWFFNSRIISSRSIDNKYIVIINKLFPLINIIENFVPLPFGLSIFLVAEKK